MNPIIRTASSKTKKAVRMCLEKVYGSISAFQICLWILCGVLIGCKEEVVPRKLSFIPNNKNGMVRFQSVEHGQWNGNSKEYYFILKQSENVQGVFQIDSTDSNLKIRLTKKNFLITSTMECISSVSGNTASCRLEIPSLEKGKYVLSVFTEIPLRESESSPRASDYNLFSGIYGKGYADLEL
ncbi:LIC_10463 family lipoprotein [Leptospira santarosai]